MTIYDSRDSTCKRPFGALKTGEKAVFTIHLPKLHHSGEPVMKVFEMDNGDAPLVIPMRFCGAGLLTNSYTCAFVCQNPGLLAYYFEISSSRTLQSIKRADNGAGVLSEHGSLWQLTVYDAAMQAPAFLREGVLYQIFPDRFCNSGTLKENIPDGRQLHDDWGGMPVWRPNAQGEVTNSDYFGGDLAGIAGKLDYLQSLGVTTLYLNPIFEAHSNHRYNTADYSKIDPLLGTNEDFQQLCEQAKAHGISIILDGVFSHTGSDSVYFNKERRYGGDGAYNNWDSPYREWYHFSNYPTQYESWWGFTTLPNVDETNPAYLEFICGENGILKQWLRLGAAGYRLDVADELPDVFLDRLHACVKSYDPDCAVIGEVWEDASNKESYGVRRRYLLGRQLDSVMNYPFKDAILDYMLYGNGDIFYTILMQILENYPKPAIQALMNSLSTHDTVRAITTLGGKEMGQSGRDWQESNHTLSAEEYERGSKLFQLASIIQFGLPGIPCIYYGDEAGLYGYRDPFNRTCYPWGSEDKTLVSFIAQLGQMRRRYPIFAEAEFMPITFSHNLCCFARVGLRHSIVFAINRSGGYQLINLPQEYAHAETLITCGEYHAGVLGPYSGVVLLSGSDLFL